MYILANADAIIQTELRGFFGLSAAADKKRARLAYPAVRVVLTEHWCLLGVLLSTVGLRQPLNRIFMSQGSQLHPGLPCSAGCSLLRVNSGLA